MKRKTKITSVKYGRTINSGNYSSIRFDLEAEVQPGQTWEEALDDLRIEGLRLEKQLQRDKY